jgi:D-alanyl-D-alanine carboxypeptidase (penicillin-binding protein 5/6)
MFKALRNSLFALTAIVSIATSLAFTSAAPPPDTVEATINCSAIPVADSAAPQSTMARKLRNAPAAPPITAAAAVVIDAETGEILWGKGEHERRSPASTTKIMTAILASESAPLDQVVVSETDGSRMIGSSIMGLRPGVHISMTDLLFGLMLPSGNDAAVEIARAMDGDVERFADRMNEKAEDIGMVNTNFTNPHGLDRQGHYSSAYDLALLGAYSMRNDVFRRVVSAREWHLAPAAGDYTLYNGNTLLQRDPTADGVKIGWTNRAGWTFVASTVRDGRRLVATVLNSSDRDADASALFDWAYGSHDWIGVSERMAITLKLASKLGVADELERTLSACAEERVA